MSDPQAQRSSPTSEQSGDDLAVIKRQMNEIAPKLTPRPSWVSHIWYGLFSFTIMILPLYVIAVDDAINTMYAPSITDCDCDSLDLEPEVNPAGFNNPPDQIQSAALINQQRTLTTVKVFATQFLLLLTFLGANLFFVRRLKRLRTKYINYAISIGEVNTVDQNGVIKTIEKIPAQRQQYVILWMYGTYIVGTMVTAGLWLIFPEKSRLEPLTIIYGFGTGLFGYIRSELKIRSPIDSAYEAPTKKYLVLRAGARKRSKG